MNLVRMLERGAAAQPARLPTRDALRDFARAHWRTALWWLPVAVAVAYAVTVLVDFRTIIAAINRNSDASVAPVLAKLWGEAPTGSHALLGNHPWYEEFLILRATSGLPHYRQLWDVLPAAWSLGALAVLVWAMRRAFGTWPALVAGAALLCVGELGRYMFFSFNWHSLAAVHIVLLGAGLVWVVERGRGWHWVAPLGLGLVLGALSAFPVASDPGFPYWALAPLLGAAVAVAWKGDRLAARASLTFGVTTAVVALVGGAVLVSAMRRHGLDDTPLHTTFVAPDRIVPNLVLLVRGYTALAGGHFFGSKPDFDGATVFVCGALALLALGLALRFAWPIGSGPARRMVVAGERGTGAVGARFAHVVFWSLALLAAVSVFVLNSAPVDVMSARYLLTGYVALGALLPALAAASPASRATLAAGVALFAAAATYQVASRPGIRDNFPTAAQANAVRDFAAAHGVQYGYADYWDAANLTWQTRFRVKVFPVFTCGDHLCRWELGQIDTWYRPRPRIRSLLIVDANQPRLQPPPPQLGTPIATQGVGSLTLYVFPYDLASRVSG